MERTFAGDHIKESDAGSISSLPIEIRRDRTLERTADVRVSEWKFKIVSLLKKPLFLVALTWTIIALLLVQELVSK